MAKLQTIYQNTIKFAAEKHADQNQVIPGTDLPYVVHLSNVTMEILIASQKQKNSTQSLRFRLPCYMTFWKTPKQHLMSLSKNLMKKLLKPF